MMMVMMKISSTWQAASFFMDSVVEVTASLRRAPWPWISIIATLSWCEICFEKENKRKVVQEQILIFCLQYLQPV